MTQWPPRIDGRLAFHGVCPECANDRWVTGWSEAHPHLCDCQRPRPHMVPCPDCVREPGFHQPATPQEQQ